MTFDKVFFFIAGNVEWKEKSKYIFFFKKKLNFDQTANTNISVDRFLQHFFVFSNPKCNFFFSRNNKFETIHSCSWTDHCSSRIWSLCFCETFFGCYRKNWIENREILSEKSDDWKFESENKVQMEKNGLKSYVFRFCLVLSQLVFPFSVFHWIIIIVFNHIFFRMFFPNVAGKIPFPKNSIFFTRTQWWWVTIIDLKYHQNTHTVLLH